MIRIVAMTSCMGGEISQERTSKEERERKQKRSIRSRVFPSYSRTTQKKTPKRTVSTEKGHLITISKII